MISFVFSNPKHHADILLPVVRTLERAGHRCRVISFAELRGLETPAWDVGGAAVRKVLPFRRPGRIPPPVTTVESGPSERRGLDVRTLAQETAWRCGLGARLRWLLRGSRAVVIPNDAAFPYLQLARSLRRRHVPYVLVQEGIRFKFPADRGTEYGRSGADRICVWGEGSAEHFAAIGVPASTIHVTGNPRFDAVDLAHLRSEQPSVLGKLGITRAPLLFLSNPIETQGYGTADEKLALFATFLRESRAAIAKHDAPLVLKLHSYEDPARFRAIASEVGVPLIVAEDIPILSLLAAARAAVVLASTVGLEALVFGIPLGVLQIPGHDFAFEYVQRGAGIGLTPGTITAGLDDLLSRQRDDKPSAFVERHLAYRGVAHQRMSDAILEAARA